MVRATSDTTSHTRTIRIIGGPQIDAGYPRGEFQIIASKIEYQWSEGSAPALVHVSGPRVLKNGTAGRFRSMAYRFPGGVPDAVWGECPDWLARIIEGVLDHNE